MEYIYLGVKLPAPRSYERIRIGNINFNENVSILREKFLELYDENNNNFSFSYCGIILDDTEPIKKYNLRSGSTVHVLRKNNDDESKEVPSKFTEMEVQRVTALYRSLNSGNFHKISRPEVAKIIYDTNPELKKDMIAISILRDPILLSNLQNPETVRKLSQHHRVLIDASETIVKALKTAKITGELVTPAAQANTDELSDSSSSSSSENNSPRASNSNMMRRITREYLTQALAQAAQQGRNSLANISQRNLSQVEGTSNPISPSPSSSSVPSGHRFISPSMFMNAMNEVLVAHRRSANSTSESTQPMDAQETSDETFSPSVINQEIDMEHDEDARMISSFAPQLQQMRDMGLTNVTQNIQALMVCNGSLEDAVNFVLADMNNMS